MEGHSVSGESRKNGWVEQKKELTKVLKIAWPAVFESFFISLAGMIDVYMVSGLGSEAVASVGLTTQPKFLGLSLFFAMNVAIAAIVARRTGEKDKRRANETLAEAILLTILFGAVITVACVSLAGWLMEKCGSAPDTHDGAVIYFQIIMGGMIFNIISMVINAAQRGAGNTKIAMYTNTISSIVNIIGNYLLIGGHLGFPKLGSSTGDGAWNGCGVYDQCNVTVSEGFLPQYSVYYKRRAVETVRIGKNNLKTFKQYIRGADSDAYRFYVNRCDDS